MISQLRKIRVQMLRQNRFRKYFFYAIGEIVLVVIGIVIAVQIGRWDEQRKLRTLEKSLLDQVRGEIESTGGDIRADLMLLERSECFHQRISRYMREDAAYADSMCLEFRFLAIDEYIYPKQAAYDKLKEEGLDIIQSDSLKIMLQVLNETMYPRISRDHPFYPDIRDHFSDYYQHHFRPNTDTSLKLVLDLGYRKLPYPLYFTNQDNQPDYRTIGYVPLDFDALKQDSRFHMLMEEARVFREYKINRYKATERTMNTVLRLIEQETGPVAGG